jgi:hypothetical protein
MSMPRNNLPKVRYQSLYPRTGKIRVLLRQQKRFIAHPRDEKRYSYSSEIDPELIPPTPEEEPRILAIVRAINVNGENNFRK